MLKHIKQLLAISMLAGLAACSTIEGAGEDIESVGDAISDEARD